MAELNADFRDLLAGLTEARADFLVVGAHALSWHGYPRSTGDLDILVAPTAENAARVFRALALFGAPLAALGITEGTLGTEGMVCQIGVPPRRIDILTRLSGVTFEEAWQSRVVGRWSGLAVPVLGRSALIAYKKATGRPKDLADVSELEKPPDRSPLPG